MLFPFFDSGALSGSRGRTGTPAVKRLLHQKKVRSGILSGDAGPKRRLFQHLSKTLVGKRLILHADLLHV